MYPCIWARAAIQLPFAISRLRHQILVSKEKYCLALPNSILEQADHTLPVCGDWVVVSGANTTGQQSVVLWEALKNHPYS